MALVGVARASEEVEAVAEPFEQRGRRQNLRARGRKLECERKPVEACAELTHCMLASTSGRTARARSQKSVTASSSASGGRSSSTSPWTRSASRLVAIRRRAGAADSSASGRAAAGRRCSTLSQTRCVRLSPIRVAIASTSAETAPTRSAIVATTSSGSRRGASATNRVPPSASSARRRASSIANRVFPVPPGPRIVSTRGSRS